MADATSLGLAQAISGRRWVGHSGAGGGIAPVPDLQPPHTTWQIDRRSKRRVHFEPEIEFLEQLLIKSDLLCMADVPFGDVSRVPEHWENGQAPWAANGTGEPYQPSVELEEELERYRLYTVDELDRLPPVEFLPGTPLASRELSGIYGKGGSFKSFIALGWACGLAARGHVVVYIAAEGGSGLRGRIHAWMQHHGVEALRTMLIMPANVAIQSLKAVDAWLEAIKLQVLEPLGQSPALVVVDTLARNFVGGDENSPQDMGEFVEGCEQIRKFLRCSVLVVHHTTKDASAERGSEALRNASFAMFKTTSRKGYDVTLRCDRMKDVAEPADQRLRLVRVEFEKPIGGMKSSLSLDVEVVERADVLRASQALLGQHGAMSENKLLKRLREGGVKIGQQNGRTLLKRYVDDPQIDIVRDGDERLARSAQMVGTDGPAP
jgi:hypothetical protein